MSCVSGSSFRAFGLIGASCLLTILGGCAFMPSSGPHASNLIEQAKDKKNPPLINLTSKDAAVLAEKVRKNQESQERDLIARLMVSTDVKNQIGPGDRLTITIWSQGGGDAGTSSATGDVALQPSAHKMGVFTVDNDGNVDLPYAGWVRVGHMSFRSAERNIRAKLASTHLFESVEVNIQAENSHYQNIVILGAVKKASVLSWNDGGIDISEAMAQAGGYELGASLQGIDMGMNIMLTRNSEVYNIPLRLALLKKIPLQPGDRVALQHKPSVRIYTLGAGWGRPSMQPFDQTPSLSQVMASAQGLNYNTAQGRAIFVLKHDRSCVYRINFNKYDGMEAAQVFPVEDGDMVYVPASRSTTLQQVMNLLMVVAGQGMTAAAIR